MVILKGVANGLALRRTALQDKCLAQGDILQACLEVVDLHVHQLQDQWWLAWDRRTSCVVTSGGSFCSFSRAAFTPCASS